MFWLLWTPVTMANVGLGQRSLHTQDGSHSRTSCSVRGFFEAETGKKFVLITDIVSFGSYTVTTRRQCILFKHYVAFLLTTRPGVRRSSHL